MATMVNGLWGGISGRIGNVVGATRNGRCYLRSIPAGTKNSKSESAQQAAQRSRFSVTLAFLKSLTDFVRIGFQAESEGMKSAFNAAMSYNVRHAVKGASPEFEIDYPNVLVSSGMLGACSVMQGSIGGGVLSVVWDIAENDASCGADQAMVVAYNQLKRSAVYDLHAGKRSGGSAQLVLPQQWQGDEVEVYLSFMSARDFTLVSDSRYGGRHRVEL